MPVWRRESSKFFGLKQFELLAYAFIFAALVGVCAKYFLEVSAGGSPWKTGDWLLSYEFGPLRRGLIGSLLVKLSGGLALKWVIFCVQVFLYILAYGLVLRVYAMRERSFSWLSLLLSPAFLLFPFYDMQGGFRKEILLFASFSCFIYFLASECRGLWILLGGAALYVVAAFSHEVAVVALPLYLYVIYRLVDLRRLSKVEALGVAIFLTVVALSSALVSVKFPGSQALAAQLCEAAIGRGFSRGVCSGAMDALSYDLAHSIGRVVQRLSDYVRFYPLMAILSIAPLLLTNYPWKRGLLLLGIAVCFLPLFVVAIDWGRWIAVYVFLLYAIVLAESVVESIDFVKIPAILVATYVAVWSIPHCCVTTMSFGLSELVFRLAVRVTTALLGV